MIFPFYDEHADILCFAVSEDATEFCFIKIFPSFCLFGII